MNIIKKIFYSIMLLLIPLIAYSLPDEVEFKKICHDLQQEKTAIKLAEMLQKTSRSQRLLWISKFNNWFNSPIVYAVYCKNIPIIKVLITSSLKDKVNYYNLTTKKGMSMLTLAALWNQIEVVKLLLDNGHPITMDISTEYTSAIHEAAKIGNISMCDLLLTSRDVQSLVHTKNYQGKTPISYLILNNQETFIIKLLDLFPIDANDMYLADIGIEYLDYALLCCNNVVVKKLLQQGLNPKNKNFLSEFSISRATKNKKIK